MGTSRNKLSLLAEYDDFCRHMNGLAEGFEKDLKIYVASRKNSFQNVKTLESENKQLEHKVNCLEKDKLRLEAELKQARSQLITEHNKSQQLKSEKNSLERQIVLIKELLSDQNVIDHTTKEKLVQLSSATSQHNGYSSNFKPFEESASLLSSDDCDETTDELESSESHPQRNSKNKNLKTIRGVNETSKGSSTYLSPDDPIYQDQTTVRRNSMIAFRSNSEPNSTSPEVVITRQIIRSDSEHIKERCFDGGKSFKHNRSVKHNRSSLPIDCCSVVGKLGRAHTFQAKTFIRAEKCHPCSKMIKFCKQGLKCSVCRISCHIECKEQCSLPCISAISIPTKGSGTIADYTSSTSPMIPSIMVHCINEIEVRGLEDIGLYRVPGREREIKELKEKFLKGKSIPSLNDIDIHAICGTVKEFLRNLKDSLITKAAWHTFVDAASQCNEKHKLNLIYEAVCDLPRPNKETLAFLILHLQRVAASPHCQMPLDNLSKVFAPTVIGYSVDQPTDTNMFSETQQQNKVMTGLLKIPAEWWQNFFTGETIAENKLKTPTNLPAPVSSRLGPIFPSNSRPGMPVIVKAHLSPRHAKSGGRTGRRQQYLSPILKD